MAKFFCKCGSTYIPQQNRGKKSRNSDGQNASAGSRKFHQSPTGNIAAPSFQFGDHRLGNFHPTSQFRLRESCFLACFIELCCNRQTLACLRKTFGIGWIIKVSLPFRLLLCLQLLQMLGDIFDFATMPVS